MKFSILSLLTLCFFTACSSTSNFDDINNGAAIEDVKWLLDGSNGKASMTFLKAEKRISATAGCNGIGGGYTLTGDKLETEQFASTLMYCDGLMDNETKLSNAIIKANRVGLSGKKLTLFDGDNILATFTAE